MAKIVINLQGDFSPAEVKQTTQAASFCLVSRSNESILMQMHFKLMSLEQPSSFHPLMGQMNIREDTLVKPTDMITIHSGFMRVLPPSRLK